MGPLPLYTPHRVSPVEARAPSTHRNSIKTRNQQKWNCACWKRPKWKDGDETSESWSDRVLVMKNNKRGQEKNEWKYKCEHGLGLRSTEPIVKPYWNWWMRDELIILNVIYWLVVFSSKLRITVMPHSGQPQTGSWGEAKAIGQPAEWLIEPMDWTLEYISICTQYFIFFLVSFQFEIDLIVILENQNEEEGEGSGVSGVVMWTREKERKLSLHNLSTI